MAATSRSFVLADVARVEQLLQVGTSRRLLQSTSNLAGRGQTPLVRPACRAVLVRHLRPGAGVGFRPLCPEQAHRGTGKAASKNDQQQGESRPDWDEVVAALQYGAIAKRILGYSRTSPPGKEVRSPHSRRVVGQSVKTPRKRPRHWRTKCGHGEPLLAAPRRM